MEVVKPRGLIGRLPLIGTCNLNGVNPEAYIAATLRRILDQDMQRDIDELMPWNFGK